MDGSPPEEQMQRAQPDVLVVGMGALGIDVRAFVEAARQRRGRCAVCLLCDRDHREQAGLLRPDRLLFRPLSVAEVQACLAELGKQALEREDRRQRSGALVLPLPPGDPSIVPGQAVEAAKSAAEAPRAVAGAAPAVAGAPRAGLVNQDLLRADDLFADPALVGRRLPEVLPAARSGRAASASGPSDSGPPPVRLVRAI